MNFSKLFCISYLDIRYHIQINIKINLEEDFSLFSEKYSNSLILSIVSLLKTKLFLNFNIYLRLHFKI